MCMARKIEMDLPRDMHVISMEADRFEVSSSLSVLDWLLGDGMDKDVIRIASRIRDFHEERASDIILLV